MDFEAFKNGMVPWDADEFMAVAEWWHEQKAKPKDDWDLGERSFLMEDEDGVGTMKISLNMFRPMNQIGTYMANKYRGDEHAPYYIERFMRVIDFLSLHHDNLRESGLVRIAELEFDEVRRELVEVLCILPYSGGSEEEPDLDYSEVVAKAWELIAARGTEDEDDPTDT